MDDDELPSFRPRFGKRRSTAADRAASASLTNAVQALVRRHGRSGPRRGSSGGGSEAHRRQGRRVVIKAHVQRLRAGGAKAASLHLRYIERDGVEKDGTKGVLYGRDLGRKLEWAAVNHHDTGHPHAHVVIRGVGLDGQEVRFDRAYIAKGLRWRAQELATEELGPRHEREVARARRREVTQERFTSLDREIERCASDQRVTRAALAASRRIDPSALLARLEQLERFGLAERASRTEWVLAPDWTQQLRELGTRGDILHAIHQALRGDPARYRIVAPGQALRDVDGTDGPLVGRVVQKGLADESKGTFYAIVETPAGVAYRLPLAASMAEDLRAGDLVSFDTRRESAVRAVDRRIAEVARDQGGLVVEPETGAEVEKVRQRLVELERLGLVRAERDARRRTLHGTRSGFERSSR